MKTFLLDVWSFGGKNSSSANVKVLWEQFGPTLSEKERLCKKSLNFTVSSGAPEKKTAACHRFTTPDVGYIICLNLILETALSTTLLKQKRSKDEFYHESNESVMFPYVSVLFS